MTTVQSRLQALFCEIFDNDDLQLHDDMSAKDVEGWDSLAQINLIIAIESEFDIRFKTNELSALTSVGALKQAILAHK